MNSDSSFWQAGNTSPRTSYDVTRAGDPGRVRVAGVWVPALWQLDFIYILLLRCCFTSTETVRTISDVEPWTATSTLTRLLSSEEYALFLQC